MPKAREGEHERESTRGGLFPLSLGGLRASPENFFFNFERFYVRFNGVFSHWYPGSGVVLDCIDS